MSDSSLIQCCLRMLNDRANYNRIEASSFVISISPVWCNVKLLQRNDNLIQRLEVLLSVSIRIYFSSILFVSIWLNNIRTFYFGLIKALEAKFESLLMFLINSQRFFLLSLCLFRFTH